MNWHQMIPAWFRRAQGGKIPPRADCDSVLSPGRQLPIVVVVSPIYRNATLYVAWRKMQPDTDPLTVFRLISDPMRLRGMHGNGAEFVYVFAPGCDPDKSEELYLHLGFARRRAGGSKAPLTHVDLDEIYGVDRYGQ